MQNLKYLLSLSNKNHATLKVIQQSILTVSLDSHTLGLHPPDNVHTSPTPPALNSPAEIDCHLHNIRSSINARNRWFDKGYTIIVETNTRAGSMGEHSPVDALVPSIVADYAVSQSIVPEAFSLPEPPPFFSDRDLDITGWERLDWVTDERIKTECIVAESRARALIADSDDSVLWFSDYGAYWIKSIGTPGNPPLIGYTLTWLNGTQLACPRTRMCNWRFNLLGTRHAGASPPRTRPPSHVPSTKLEQRRSVL
jgi:carnitine O-acetyltransferase